MRTLIIKKLVATDLILFKSLFQIRVQLGLSVNTKQKAISPPAELVRQIFPEIQDGWRTRIDLTVFGPGPGNRHRFEDRSFSRQDKNWRIEGDIDDLPIGSPYVQMRPDDYAVIVFKGERLPTEADIYLLSHADPGDQGLLRAAIETHHRLSHRSRSRTSTAGCLATPGDILAVLDPYHVPEGHPLLLMLVAQEDGPLAEEIAAGQTAVVEIRRRAGRRPLSPEEFRRALERKEQIGRQGELIVHRWLEAGHGRRIAGHRWVSRDFPGMPYDFEVHELSGLTRRLEVKSTSGAFDTAFRMSRQELDAAADTTPYSIVRLFGIGSPAPVLRLAENANLSARRLRGQLTLPPLTSLGDLWIEPRAFDFGDELEIEPRLL